MTTFTEFKERFIAERERELLFKEAALRYCRHSKKRAKLGREVQELKNILAYLRGETDELL